MFEQTFKNIAADLRNEAGCTTEHDYTEQTSWLLSLKHLDGLEQDKAMEAELGGKKYTFILDKPYRWSTWAAPKDIFGDSDHNKAQTGDDLRDFVDRKLFPNVAYALPPLTREGRAAKAKVILQYGAAGLSGFRAVALSQRRRGRVGPRQAHISRLHRGCRGRPRQTG
jgi:hypothetical protein